MDSLRRTGSSEAAVARAEWHFFPAGLWTVISSTFFLKDLLAEGFLWTRKLRAGARLRNSANRILWEQQFNALQR